MNELLIDLHALWHELAPMLVAAVCGSVIGLEREMRGKPSGVKTTPVGITPDGLAVDPLTGRVYISNSNSNSVSIIER